MKKIQVLGPGCPNCRRLEENTRKAVEELGIECEIEKVSDINQIAAMGVLRTPALVVDDNLKLSGKVPNIEELKNLLQQF